LIDALLEFLGETNEEQLNIILQQARAKEEK
jgi:hypothetical protein